jgi:hypothetical protein
MKILKIAMCPSGVSGDYFVYKVFRLKEDGIWHKHPGPAFPFRRDSLELDAKLLGAEFVTELPDDAVTDNPLRDREFLRRQRRTKTTKIRGSSHFSGYAPERNDTEKWEILENDLPRLSQMQGFLRVVPTQNHFTQPPKGYCTVEVLNGSDADRHIER